MDLLQVLVVIDNPLAPGDILFKVAKDLIVILSVLSVHIQNALHLLENSFGEMGWLSEEQIVHVMHEELKELVLEYSLLHIRKHLSERLGMLSHDRIRIEDSLWTETNSNLEKRTATWITKDVIEVLLGVQE